jgi:toxin ParE1/3/4
MTPRSTWRPQAQSDLIEQAVSLADHDLDVADRFLEATEQTVSQLLKMPKMGKLWPVRHPRLAGIRSWRVKGFVKILIFYLPVSDGIEIVRLLHAAQDIDAILAQEEA